MMKKYEEPATTRKQKQANKNEDERKKSGKERGTRAGRKGSKRQKTYHFTWKSSHSAFVYSKIPIRNFHLRFRLLPRRNVCRTIPYCSFLVWGVVARASSVCVCVCVCLSICEYMFASDVVFSFDIPANGSRLSAPQSVFRKTIFGYILLLPPEWIFYVRDISSFRTRH